MPRHQQPLLSALIPCLLLALLLAALLPHPAAAQNSTEVTIYNASDKYAYYGCYNETTGLAGTSGARALSGGANEVGTGNMTVPICLGFCSSGGTEYKYAGIEYARECWCSQFLSSLSAKMPDSDCNLGCDGNEEQACGGALKLTVYMLNAAPSTKALSGVFALVVIAATAVNLM